MTLTNKTILALSLAALSVSFSANAQPARAARQAIRPLVNAQIAQGIAKNPRLLSTAESLLGGQKFTGSAAQILALNTLLGDANTSALESKFLTEIQTLQASDENAAELQALRSLIVEKGSESKVPTLLIQEALAGIEDPDFAAIKGVDDVRCLGKFTDARAIGVALTAFASTTKAVGYKAVSEAAVNAIIKTYYPGESRAEALSKRICEGLAAKPGSGCNLVNLAPCGG